MHSDMNTAKACLEYIVNSVREAEVGKIYTGKVVRIEPYGAFVELFKGTDALLHVSKIAHERIDKPEDVLKLGDKIKVKVIEIDEKGKVNVSAKDLLPKPEKKEKKSKNEEYLEKHPSLRKKLNK